MWSANLYSGLSLPRNTMKPVILLLIFSFQFFIVVRAQDEDVMPALQKNEAAVEATYVGNPVAIKAGAELYATVCSGCHGPSGEGGRGPSLVRGNRVRQVSDVKLFASIQAGVPGTDMPPFPFPDEQIWQLVAFTRSLVASAYESDVPGDAGAGETVFFGKGGCTNCHMICGKGGFLGPDLTVAGVTNTIAQLREAFVDPNRRTSDGYRVVTVETAEGKKISGIARNNSNYSIQMIDKEGKLHLLAKQDLRSIEFPQKSWMPDDYADRLSEEEVQNVLAFLSRQAAHHLPAAPKQTGVVNR